MIQSSILTLLYLCSLCVFSYRPDKQLCDINDSIAEVQDYMKKKDPDFTERKLISIKVVYDRSDIEKIALEKERNLILNAFDESVKVMNGSSLLLFYWDDAAHGSCSVYYDSRTKKVISSLITKTLK